jgi:hypothetical protein
VQGDKPGDKLVLNPAANLRDGQAIALAKK